MVYSDVLFAVMVLILAMVVINSRGKLGAVMPTMLYR